MPKLLIITVALLFALLMFGGVIPASREYSKCFNESIDRINRFDNSVRGRNISKERICELGEDDFVQLNACLNKTRETNVLYKIALYYPPFLNQYNDTVDLHNRNCKNKLNPEILN